MLINAVTFQYSKMGIYKTGAFLRLLAFLRQLTSADIAHLLLEYKVEEVVRCLLNLLILCTTF